MRFQRSSGVLLHPTSLPGSFGIGDIGPAARAFCDLLAEAGQQWWQILPLGPTGYGDSPYQSFSAFAGNTLLISPDELVDDGLLTKDELADVPNFPPDRVEYGGVYVWKKPILKKVFENFKKNLPRFEADLHKFFRENSFWLDDYAMFQALRNDQGNRSWNEWPDELKNRDPEALAAARKRLDDQFEAEVVYQFLFFRQWAALKKYANQQGIRIIGDIPIFVAYDSADVWCNQDQFKLNEDGSPRVVSGVPPDFFSKTGQLWGNPIYDWDAMAADGFKWWAARVYRTLQAVDVARLDHFRGFVSAWEVPGEDETAENGQWVEVPGHELFEELEKGLGPLPVIAEDLGHITPEVEALLDEFEYPGMRILQFGFGGDARNRDLPHNYVEDRVAYTGTHDNDTAVGWYRSLDRRVKEHAKTYLNSNGRQINWDMIRAVFSSVAELAIIPAQDILGLGNEARMNLPASESGNWQWRMQPHAWSPEVTRRLRDLTALYGRDG